MGPTELTEQKMKTNRNSIAWFTVGIFGAIASVGFGFYLGQSTNGISAVNAEQAALQAQFEEMQRTVPLRLAADSAAGGKTISVATGSITAELDGVFILDHLTGGLQCWILNSDGGVGGIYVADVGLALGLDKGDPDFVMATGDFFVRSGGNRKIANTICYVGEGKSGKMAGFGLTYDKAGVQRGAVQQGELNMVCSGPIRQAGAIRE
jgi:hypothetical protein